MAKKMTDDERKEADARRAENLRTRMQLYEKLYEVATIVSGMPMATDVVKLVRGHERHGKVSKHIPMLLRWMKEFDDAWNAHEEK